MSDLVSQAFEPYATYFMIFTSVSLILGVVILVLWILSMIRHRKVQAAIFDMQEVLHEMNERDKVRSTPSPAPSTVATAVPSSETKI